MPINPPISNQDGLIYHILNKIYQLLPAQSGLSLIDVEDDTPIFLNARRSLIHISEADHFNDVLHSIIETLESMNEADTYLILKQRSVTSLSSILIMVRLLADLCEINWSVKEPSSRKNSMESSFSNSSTTSGFGVGFASISTEFHTVQPSILKPDVVSRAISLISKLKSTNSLTQELALMNGKPLSQTNLYEDISIRPLIDQIDYNCESILRFLAAANPMDFFHFVTSKLTVLKHNVSNESDFAPYLELFSCVYLNQHLLLEYLKQIRVIIGSLKRDSYRQLVFSFLLKSIKVWIQSRPAEFIDASKPDSNISMEAETLFDDILALTDVGSQRNIASSQQKQFRSSYKFLAFLLTLYPKPLLQYFSEASNNSSSKTTSTLKKITNISSNKKQKILGNVIKQLTQSTTKDITDNFSVLKSLDFMVFIANVAAATFTTDPNNIVVKFSLYHYDLVSKILIPITSNQISSIMMHPSITELDFFNELRLDYFSSLCVLNPKEIFPDLMKIMNDENSSLESLSIVCSILKIYSSIRSLENVHQNHIIDALPALRSIMMRVSMIVKASSYSGSVYEEDLNSGIYKTNSVGSNDHSIPQYKSLLGDTSSKSSKNVDSVKSGISTPKTDKLKESTKIFFRNHSYSNQITPLSDDTKSLDSKDSSFKAAVISRHILTISFKIFRKYPHKYLYAFEKMTDSELILWLTSHIQELCDPLITALNDSNSKLKLAVKDFIHSFYVTTTVTDDLETTVSAFSGSAQIAYSLTKYILNNFSSDSRKKYMFESFVRLLEYRIRLHTVLSQHSFFYQAKIAESPVHSMVASSIEETLIFCLTASDQESYNLIKRGIRAYSQEYQLNDTLISNPESNLDFLIAIGNDKMVTTGSVALHKNIQKYFAKITTPTIPVREAYSRIYDKWFKLAKSEYSMLSTAELMDFRNFASFLASTSGLFVDLDTPIAIKNEFSDRVETFISQQLTMLSNENLVTRENAKEILAAEMNSKSYTTIMSLIKPMVEQFHKKDNLSTMDWTVCELLIVIVKALLDNGDDVALFLISTDTLDCASMLASIITNAPEVDKVMIRLQMRCSLLFYKIESHKDSLRIQSAYKLRNNYLRFVFKWFENAVLYESPKDTGGSTARVNYAAKDLEYVYVDLTLESAKALSLLLDSLILEAPRALSEHELKFYKARIFSVYFNTLLKALEKYTDVDSFSQSIKHKVVTISEYITASLTNLLKANVDVGLSYALPIGYHINTKVRIAFLKVFTSIVADYNENREANIAEAKKVSVTAFRKTLGNPRFFSCIGKACPIGEAAAMTSTILTIANSYNQCAPLVSFLLKEEIDSGTSYTDILRRNSFASRSLSAFGRIKGSEYLVEILRPVLTEVKDFDGELEVEKIDLDDPEADTNLDNFFYCLTKLVDAIANSVDKAPKEFKLVCQTISEAVDKKFPNYRSIAVGSFVFLRFFCPAIVSPESEKIVEVPTRQIQRRFLLLAKVLQNIANGSLATLKWSVLKKRETQINKLNDKIMNFMDQISTPTEPMEFPIIQPETIDDVHFSFIYSFLYERWMDVRREYSKSYQSSAETDYSRRIADVIMNILKAVGQPTASFGYEMPDSITPESNSHLYDFMIKNASKDVSSILDSGFVRQDITQDGLPLFVVSYQHASDITQVDHDTALYRCIQVASKIWDNKFAWVVDCTGFTDVSSYPKKLALAFGRICPPQFFENCIGLYYYNISPDFFKVLSENLKDPVFILNSPQFITHFRSSMDDKKTVMNLGLPKSTTKAYYDVRVKFTDASIYQADHRRFVPVVIKIGHENLQICQTTPKRVKMRDGIKSVFLVDVLKLENITSVGATETTKIPNEISLNFKDGRSIILSSPKYLEIMRLLYFTKNRTSNTVTDSLLSGATNTSIEDLSGQVYNVIFFGLTSSSTEVRSISYNLLALCQKKFGIELGRELIELHEIYFPGGSNSFVVSMSENLAKTSPHFTFEFIMSFFKIYADAITSRQRLSAILYVSPWVDNVYEYVFKSDDEHGPDLVAEIIRTFLKVSVIDPAFLSAFNSSFWSKLCLQERISSILVNEIVLSAIDCEAEGSDWKRTISILTSTPTIELCSCVIKRLRDISHIPFPDSRGSYSVAAHSNWIEITVLIQMAVSLVFNNYIYAEMFLPDVFYIITILIDVGPLDLRIASHQLLLNLLQAFLSDPNLSDESKDLIRLSVEQFTTHRSRLLFGLNRETDETLPNEISKFSAKISTVESLVSLLLDVVDNTPGFSEHKTVWFSRLNRYVIDAAVRKDSILRGRALLLVGIISKRGINDNIFLNFLKMIVDDARDNMNDLKFNYLAICTVFSLSNIALGLLPDSVLHIRLFWLAIGLTHSSHTALYQGGLQFVTNIIISMKEKNKYKGTDLIDTILNEKSVFEPIISQAEDFSGIRLTAKNFDHVLLHLSSKGFQLPYARTKTVQSMITIFQIRYECEMKRQELEPTYKISDGPLCYLLFLFIVSKQSELKEILSSVGIEDNYIVIDDEVHVPRILTDYIMNGGNESHIALVIATTFINEGEPNDKMIMRFVQLLKFISKRSDKFLIGIYYEIQMTLRKVVKSSMNTNLVTEVFELASIAYVSDGYEENDKYRNITDEILFEYNLSGIRNYRFSADQFIRAPAQSSGEVASFNFFEPIARRILDTQIETA